ncbi:hypothetical protein D3C75_1211700 [compost metagenome]
MLKCMADRLWRSILYSDIAFSGSILLRYKSMFTARYLGRNNLAYAFSSMVRIGEDYNPSALHCQRYFGNNLTVYC